MVTERINRFVSAHADAFSQRQVDYLGINVAADPAGEPVCKLYYRNRASRDRTHPLIEFLKSRDMVRYLTMVRDLEDSRRLRFDVGLRNRTDDNMRAVFAWLAENTGMFGAARQEIEELSSMKVTERDGYKLAGLYFLGFIAVDEEISVLKTHYFNRICEDPDVLHKNLTFADDAYLDFLAASRIPSFHELSGLTGRILAQCGGHLWMTGADYALSGARKYKIYIKEPADPYQGLLNVLAGDTYGTIRQRIRSVMEWDGSRKAFFCEGFAVCMDEKAGISVNFYFRPTEDEEMKHQ